MNKQKVIEVYLNYLDRKIKDTENALESLYEGIDTAPGPSQSHSDTTRFQQSRVALETEGRLSSLKGTRAVATLIPSVKLSSPIVGALIEIEDLGFGETEYYFVVPWQGGESFLLDNTEVMSVSPQAPILDAVANAKEGDIFEFRGRRLKLASIS